MGSVGGGGGGRGRLGIWCSDPCRRWEGRSATDAAPGRKAGRNHRRPKCVRREEGGLWASSTVLPRRFCGAAITFPALLLADSFIVMSSRDDRFASRSCAASRSLTKGRATSGGQGSKTTNTSPHPGRA